MYLAREHRKRKDPRPGGSTDGRLPVDAALLVAPTANPATTRPQVDIPISVVLPGCDGDVVGLDGAMYHDHARLAAKRTTLAAAIVVRGANHNAFNAAVKADDATLVTTPGCVLGAPQRLRPKAQRTFLVDYASAFADTVLRGIVAGGLDPFVQPPAELFGATVTTSLTLPSAQRLVVLEPRSRGNLKTNALRGAVRTIERHKPVLAVEINRNTAFAGVEPERLRDWICAQGYAFSFKVNSDEVFLPC
jgi:hypothetical protein